VFALAACEAELTDAEAPTGPGNDPTTGGTTKPGEGGELLMVGQVVNDRTQTVPSAKVVLVWGDFGAMFPPWGVSVNLTGSFPEAFQLSLDAPPAADRLFLPSLGFPEGYFDPALESRIAIARIQVVRREANATHFNPVSDLLGEASDYAVVYAEKDVVAGTAGAAYLGGPARAGYHIVNVANDAARDAVYAGIAACQSAAIDVAGWKACGIYTSLSIAAGDQTVGVGLVDEASQIPYRWLGPTYLTPGAPTGPVTCVPPTDPNLMPCPQ
jgi:hypothetical protein